MYIKKAAVLVAPLLLFALLLVPYSLANQHFIVKWLGCGCPVTDELGNTVENNFNANDVISITIDNPPILSNDDVELTDRNMSDVERNSLHIQKTKSVI